MGRPTGYGGTRYRVLALLSDIEWKRSAEIAEELGMAQSLVCNHLRALERAGVVVCRGGPRSREWCWQPDNGGDNVNKGRACAPGTVPSI